MAPRKSKSRLRTPTKEHDTPPEPTPAQAPDNRKWLNIIWYIFAVLGPPLLVFFYVRCAKNLCILWYFPFTLPQRLEDYITGLSVTIVLGFVAFQMVWKRLFQRSTTEDGLPDEDEKVPTAFSSFVFLTALFAFLFATSPGILQAIQDQLVAILVSTIALAILYCVFISVVSLFSFTAEADRGLLALFFQGPDMAWPDALSEWFFFTHIGFVGWGLLDVMIILNAIGKGSASASAYFLFFTQLVFVAHCLLFEKFFCRRMFIRMEKLSYTWMAKFLIFLPFLGALPLFHVTVSNFYELPKPVHLVNFVLFLFGFLIYTTANHQMDRFLKDPEIASCMEFVSGGHSSRATSKRFLVSGYWSFVRRPDYLGLLVMWMSWMICAGPSALTACLMALVTALVVVAAEQADSYNRTKYQRTFTLYSERVPRKLIPYVF